jgi:PAS domain S-box-containing protein
LNRPIVSTVLAAGLWLGAIVARGQSPTRAGGVAAVPDKPVLVVGATADNFPYSYVGQDGVVRGFAVDLLDAVARAMNLNLRRVVAPASEIQANFQKGSYDFLQVYSQSPERATFAEFSVPFLTLQGCVFVRASNGPPTKFSVLSGRTFAVVGTKSTGVKFLQDQALTPNIVYAGSPEAALTMVHTGIAAGTFLSRLTALSVINRLGLHDITMAGEPVQDYDIRHSYAVHQGNAQLLARLNEGLAIVHRNGEYDEIYRRWFGRFDSPLFTREQVILYVTAALGLALAITLWAFFRQRSLRRSLARQTAQLAEQRALLQALYDNIPTAMTVLEREGEDARMISVNRQAGSLYALEPATAAGQLLSQLALNDSATRHFREVVRQWPAAGKIRHDEVRFEGNRRILAITLVPLTTAKHGPPRLCVLAEDITTRRQMDEEIAQTRKLRAVGELVGGIAHEFNNLLTPVMLKVDEIKYDWSHDIALQQCISVISQAVHRTADLTRRLLTFGRKTETRAEAVILENVVNACFELLRHTIDRRIVWESQVAPGLPALSFNSTDLNQILLNLLINARDTLLDKLSKPHAPDWIPTIHVDVISMPVDSVPPMPTPSAIPLRGWQRLTVRDNGFGMPPAIVERIFEPFFTTKEVGKGTGLGLATVWHLITGAGGRVEVESSPGEGSAFHIYLPVIPIAAMPRAPDLPSKPLSATRVLLIEDEPLISDTITVQLRRAGHTVNHLSDGAEAWRYLERNLKAYELLIIDVNLPGMSGIELVTRIRGCDFDGRILIMSGRFETSDLKALARLKIDGAITKPFSVQQFETAMRECLAPRAESIV